MNDVTDLIKRLREAVHAWVREDLDTGAKMLIGFHGPKLIARLEAATALERLSGKPDEEAVARVIDRQAMEWTKPWRDMSPGFYADETVQHRWEAIRRDEDEERSQMMRRKALALTKAREILSLSRGGSGENGSSSRGSTTSDPRGALPTNDGEPR